MRRRRPLDIPYAEAAADLEALVSARSVSPTDAGAFADAASYHGLTGYAVEAIGRGRLVLLPEEARRLAGVQAKRLLHAALLRRELAAAVASLGAIGVAPLLVKGPAVANRFYRDPALRTFADLHLLVPRQRLADGLAALAGAGYSIVGDYRPDYPESLYHDVHLERSAGSHRVDIDLHWRLGDDPLTVELDHDALASGAEQLDVDGTTVLVPALPEQLLALAVHFLSDVARRRAGARLAFAPRARLRRGVSRPRPAAPHGPACRAPVRAAARDRGARRQGRPPRGSPRLDRLAQPPRGASDAEVPGDAFPDGEHQVRQKSYSTPGVAVAPAAVTDALSPACRSSTVGAS